MSEWRESKLRVLVGSPISGSRPTGGANEQTEGVPSLGGENIKSNGGVDYTSFKNIPESFFRLMPKGRLQALDVLINKDGAQTGKVGLYDGRFEQAAANEHLFILRSKDGAIDQTLLYYYLLLDETQIAIARRITGSAQPGLNSQFVDAVCLRIPTASTQQRRIAEILSTVDEAIEQTERLIAKQQQIKAGLMQDLFTRGVWTAASIKRARVSGSPAAARAKVGQLRPPREIAPELYKESPLGWIPQDWEVKKLSACAAKTSGSTTIGPFGSDLIAADYRSEGVPVVFVRDIKADGFVWKSNVYVSTRKAVDLAAHSVRAGDILATKMGLPPCVACLYPNDLEPGVITADVVRLRPDLSVVEPVWLSAAINSDSVKRQVMAITAGVTRPKITLSDFRNLAVSCPSVEEQQLVAKMLNTASDQETSETRLRENLIKQKQGLMQDLLTGRVSVEK